MASRKIKWLAGWSIGEVISNLIWSFWPIYGAPIVTGALAYIGGYSPTIIFLLCLGAFAIVALGLNNFSQWSASRNPADKVQFIGAKVAANINDTVDPPRIRGIKLGIMALSMAPFAIEIRIDSLNTQIANRVPTDQFNVRSVKVAQGMGAEFSNSLIDLSNMELADTVQYGQVTAKISYGRPGKLKYTAEQTRHLAFKFDRNGGLANVEQSLTQFSRGVGDGNG